MCTNWKLSIQGIYWYKQNSNNLITVLEKIEPSETENCIFSWYFLNGDVSLNILFLYMKFYILILHIVIEGTVSQNFDLGPSFHFIDSRKWFYKKIIKSYLFFQIKSELNKKNLRHSSLKGNFLDVCIKLYYWGFIIKRNIAIKKNKKIGPKCVFSLVLNLSKYHWHQHMQKNMPFHLIYHMTL